MAKYLGVVHENMTPKSMFLFDDRKITGKIPMIKEVRNFHGVGLKSAKFFVDYLEGHPGVEVRYGNWAMVFGGDTPGSSNSEYIYDEGNVVTPVPIPEPTAESLFPDVPLEVHSNIRIGELRYSVDLDISSLKESEDEIRQIIEATKALVMKFVAEMQGDF